MCKLVNLCDRCVVKSFMVADFQGCRVSFFKKPIFERMMKRGGKLILVTLEATDSQMFVIRDCADFWRQNLTREPPCTAGTKNSFYFCTKSASVT